MILFDVSLGVVLMDNVKWLSFHSGYDFGYLLKILTCQNLPQVRYRYVIQFLQNSGL
jgi:hypothetical protein